MFSLTNLPLNNKIILVRVDYNAPFKGNKILDNNKIKCSLTTIKFLLKQDCKIVLMTHLGRPKGKIVPALKLNKISKELKKLLPKQKITKLNDCIGEEIKFKIMKGKPKQIFLLENLRFYSEEEENDYSFAHSLANLADFYINDAFAVSHRKHASVDAITKFIPSAPGFLLETEILNIKRVLNKPLKPSLWVMGGAKLNKVKLLTNGMKKSDHILLGGALAFPFLKSKGFGVGHSLLDVNSTRIAKNVLKNKLSKKIIFPVDFICTDKISTKTKKHKTVIRKFDEIEPHEIALDIGPKTVKIFEHYIKEANTIVWNGPMGYFELTEFRKGTKKIIESITKGNKITICGGGETAEIVKKLRKKNKFTHVSTGGGASLQFLSGEKMPGIESLEKNYNLFKKRRTNRGIKRILFGRK